MRKSLGVTLQGWALVCLATGCATEPLPVVIHETPREAISLQFDPEAGTGHSHPASVTTEQMATVLRGIRVTKRDAFGLGGLLGKTDATPAFSAGQIAVLATHLTEALRKASSKDVATFYLVASDPTLGRLITSGGVFVRSDRLFFILANFHTPPSASPYEAVAYELDNREEPLMPIARYRFTVGFIPHEARVSTQQIKTDDGYRRNMDESKLVVIDLSRLSTSMKASSSTKVPTSLSAL